MNIHLSLPDEVRTYIEEQVTAGGYSTIEAYFLELIEQDRKRRSQEKLEALLLEGINSEGSQEVTPEFWQQLRASVLRDQSSATLVVLAEPPFLSQIASFQFEIGSLRQKERSFPL